MKIALIGSNGLLGSAIKKLLLNSEHNTLLLTHDIFEITDPSCYSQIKDFQADIVINTAAYLGVEPCENNPVKAFKINTIAVNQLAHFCKEENITFVQISTDGVFSGEQRQYDESIIPEPINIYGISKYNAELLVQNICSKYYILRIPILFGLRENVGNIFIEKMYNLYSNGLKELHIADDIVNRPSYSVDIAQEIIRILDESCDYGTYHLFNKGEQTSLYDFATEFFKRQNISDIKIIRAKAKDFQKNEKGLKPLNTALTSIKIQPLRDWKEAMNEYCKERCLNEN